MIDAECLFRLVAAVIPALSSGRLADAVLPRDTLFALLRRMLADERAAFEADPVTGLQVMHGTPAANHALASCDLLLALGARFDDRATGDAKRFCPNAAVVHIDIDPTEHHKNRRAHVALAGDAGRVLQALLPLIPTRPRPDWAAHIARLRREHTATPPGRDDVKSPYGILTATARAAGPEAIVTTDVGQGQMRAAQVWPCRQPGRFLTSGGLGTMSAEYLREYYREFLENISRIQFGHDERLPPAAAS